MASGDALFEKYIDAFSEGSVLEDLKRRFFVEDAMFPSDRIDPYELARREGNREVVLYIMNKIGKAKERRATRG